MSEGEAREVGTRPKEPGDDAGAAPSYGATARGVLLLSVAILGLWSLWGMALRPALASDAEWIGVAARLVFWVLPATAFLVHAHGRDFWVPWGFHFPYGRRQVVLSVITPLVVGLVLLVGTSTQLRVPVIELVRLLQQQAEPRLSAPFFEELVFRGTITAEALTLARLSARDASSLRRRYWGAQVGAAVVFTLVHWPVWFEIGGMSHVLSSSFPIFVTGLVLGFVFAQTRSIYVVVALHWLNNELSLLTF